MLSSFIALAAGLIGSTPLEAVPAEPVPVIKADAPAPSATVIERVVTAEPAPQEAPAPLIEVQDVEPPVEAPTSDSQARPDSPAQAPALSTPAPEASAPVQTAPVQRRADPSILSVTERRAVLKSASDAMSRVETAKGRFIQVDANGGLSEGEFFLQRPGRMRFEYDEPVPILIAADGVTVAMRDEELETVDRVPLGATPLGLLLDDNLDFETEAEVIRVQRANGIVAITVVDPTEEAQGELTLIFNAGSYDLLAWRVLDANGGLTTVELQDVQTGISLNPRLFIVEDFEDEEDDRRR
ncbi:MAG: outer-membrane lipoprotein carrier protein LolA [Pseudomonadota bacterium]